MPASPVSAEDAYGLRKRQKQELGLVSGVRSQAFQLLAGMGLVSRDPQKIKNMPAPPNYPLRYPIYQPIETIRYKVEGLRFKVVFFLGVSFRLHGSKVDGAFKDCSYDSLVDLILAVLKLVANKTSESKSKVYLSVFAPPVAGPE